MLDFSEMLGMESKASQREGGTRGDVGEASQRADGKIVERPNKAFGKMYYRREHIPTPDEIAAECKKLQAGWSEKERRLRAGLRGLARSIKGTISTEFVSTLAIEIESQFYNCQG